MKQLKITKKPKRDTPLTVRLPKTTVEKLQKYADKNSLSQADIIEHLIEQNLK